MFPLFSGGWCIKCKVGLHRECCRRYGSICSEIAVQDPAFGRKSAAGSVTAGSHTSSTLLSLPTLISGFIHISGDKPSKVEEHTEEHKPRIVTLTVCDDQKWTSNLNTIWTNLLVSAQASEFENTDRLVLGIHSEVVEVSPSESTSSETCLTADINRLINEILVPDQKSFLSFTVFSLLQLYILDKAHESEGGRYRDAGSGAGAGTGTAASGHCGSPTPPTDDQLLESIRDGRECLNVIIQAVLLWVDQWCLYTEDYRNGSSTWMLDRKALVAHCSSRVQYCTAISYGIHEREDEWKHLVNSLENAVLRWNDCILYKQLYKLCCKLTKSKDAQLRVIINRCGPTYGTGSAVIGSSSAGASDLSFNSKFCHLNSNFMRIIEQFETIGAAVTPLDKLSILVGVLQQILKDGATPPDHHIFPIQTAEARSSVPAVAPPASVLDTDQLLQKFIEIIKYSYLSGNGINWYAECDFMHRLMFTGVICLRCGQQDENGAAAQSALIKSSVICANQDWLLGMEGYALVSLQQGLDSLLFG